MKNIIYYTKMYNEVRHIKKWITKGNDGVFMFLLTSNRACMKNSSIKTIISLYIVWEDEI